MHRSVFSSPLFSCHSFLQTGAVIPFSMSLPSAFPRLQPPEHLSLFGAPGNPSHLCRSWLTHGGTAACVYVRAPPSLLLHLSYNCSIDNSGFSSDLYQPVLRKQVMPAPSTAVWVLLSACYCHRHAEQAACENTGIRIPTSRSIILMFKFNHTDGSHPNTSPFRCFKSSSMAISSHPVPPFYSAIAWPARSPIAWRPVHDAVRASGSNEAKLA